MTQPDMGWLLSTFTDEVPKVCHTIAVSADGLLLAASRNLPTDRGDQLAAITSGLISLTTGAAGLLEAGQVHRHVVEMHDGFLFVMPAGVAGAVAALATHDADVGQVGYELALLLERVGYVLEPEPATAATIRGDGQ